MIVAIHVERRRAPKSCAHWLCEMLAASCGAAEVTPVDAALYESAELCRHGDFEGGRRVAAAATDANGWTPRLAYNEALCAYKACHTV